MWLSWAPALVALMVSVDVEQHLKKNTKIRGCNITIILWICVHTSLQIRPSYVTHMFVSLYEMIHAPKRLTWTQLLPLNLYTTLSVQAKNKQTNRICEYYHRFKRDLYLYYMYSCKIKSCEPDHCPWINTLLLQIRSIKARALTQSVSIILYVNIQSKPEILMQSLPVSMKLYILLQTIYNPGAEVTVRLYVTLSNQANIPVNTVTV